MLGLQTQILCVLLESPILLGLLLSTLTNHVYCDIHQHCVVHDHHLLLKFKWLLQSKIPINNNFCTIPQFLGGCIIYGNFIICKYLCIFMILYLFRDYCLFRGMCHFNGTFLFEGYDFRNCGSSLFRSAIFFKNGVLLPFYFLLWGIKSFELKGRPHFRRVIDDSLAAIIAIFPIGILILAGVFAAGI